MRPKTASLTIRILLLLLLISVETGISIQFTRANTIETESSRSIHRSDRMSPELSHFFEKNPTLELIRWKNDGKTVELYFEKEKIESYDIGGPSELKSLENKYGKLPAAGKWGSSK
jgi:hypothetical protein